MYSIKRRLNILIFSGSCILLLCLGFVLDGFIGAQLENQFNRALIDKSNLLVTITSQQNGEVEFDFADEFMPEFERAKNPEYFQVNLYQGNIFEKSHSLATHTLPSKSSPESPMLLYDIELPDGRPGRAVDQTFIPQLEDKHIIKPEHSPSASMNEMNVLQAQANYQKRYVSITLARSTVELNQQLTRIHMTLAIAGLVFLALTALFVGYSVQRCFMPVTRLSQRIAAMDVHTLDELDQHYLQTRELHPVVLKLNHLLGDLKHTFQREKQFTNDVAHELRTPLTEMRTLTDVGRQFVGNQERMKEYFQDLNDISIQMQAIVNNLLQLARCDAGKQNLQLSNFDVNELIDHSWSQLASQAKQKSLCLHNCLDKPFVVYCDKIKFDMLLHNLIDNTVNYARDNSEIRIDFVRHTTSYALHISNYCDNLNQEDIGHMFDRFWQKDSSRTHSQHAGLGLALVKALCEVLNLKLCASLQDDSLFTIQLRGLCPARNENTTAASSHPHPKFLRM